MNSNSMLEKTLTVIRQGDNNGHNMLAKFKLPSGLEIIGLPTKNYYGGDWDYGPSWNYLVLADKPFLIDSGRKGMGKNILQMLDTTGVSIKDIDSLVVGHGHEDHDGGLAELVKETGKPVKAHSIYNRLIRFYPGQSKNEDGREFPACCWHCFMPESFTSEFCHQYHAERSRLTIEELEEESDSLGKSIKIFHVPGHSPDSIAIQLGDEAVLVGDTVLPEITPYPTQENFFPLIKEIVSPQYTAVDSIYGLRAYIKSLKKLKELGEKHPNILVFPSHRLFYKNRWNALDLQTRIDELIAHHINRCADILNIIRQSPKTVEEIVTAYFPANLLEGLGNNMACNEIQSHCELLSLAEDIYLEKNKKFSTTGNSNFESTIHSL